MEGAALTVTINAPAETDVVDQIVAGVIGQRPLGPYLPRPAEAPHVRLLYRIPMRALAAAGLYLLVMGKLGKLMRAIRNRHRGEGADDGEHLVPMTEARGSC